MNTHPSPPSASVVTIHLWGIEWPVSVRKDGTVSLVRLHGRWLDARETLRDSICDALESEFRAMEAA